MNLSLLGVRSPSDEPITVRGKVTSSDELSLLGVRSPSDELSLLEARSPILMSLSLLGVRSPLLMSLSLLGVRSPSDKPIIIRGKVTFSYELSLFFTPHLFLLLTPPLFPQILLQSEDANAQKVNSIDQSSKSEAVKKSLEKNPDISQEKDRLLSGEWVWSNIMQSNHAPSSHSDWSTTSGSLKQKLEETRRRISVAKEMESLLMQCQNAMEEYQTFLSLPLPPSPELEIVEEEMSLNLVGMDVHADMVAFRKCNRF